MRIVILDDSATWRHRLDSARCVVRRWFRSRIFDAIERGDDQLALRLATPARLQRCRNEWNQSPLAAAIVERRTVVACEFVRRGSSLVGDGALAHAAMAGDLQVVQALLCVQKDPDEPLADDDDRHRGATPLMWATNRKHFAVMEALLAAGANVNATSEDGSTAAIFTRDAEPADLKALEILCRYKPDITLKDWRGRNLIREALDRERFGGRPEMRQLLERFFPETDFNGA